MQIIAAKSCNRLFITCVGIQIAVNIVFHLPGFFYPENLMLYLCAGALQLIFSFFVGLYIRRKNKTLLAEQVRERKRYAVITLAGLAVFLIIFFCPDLIAMPYMYVQSFFYNMFGINRLFTMFDFLSILICTSCVFFKHGESSEGFCKGKIYYV